MKTAGMIKNICRNSNCTCHRFALPNQFESVCSVEGGTAVVAHLGGGRALLKHALYTTHI